LKIGITGASGFLGWHVRAWLYTYKNDWEVRVANRNEFEDIEKLTEFCGSLDAVIHCAGMNRGSDSEVESTNIELATRLSAACTKAFRTTGQFPHVVFANSTHIDRRSAYASGKKLAAEILAQASEKARANFSNVILPNLFGESGRPFYNSVVSTFCYQLTAGETPSIHQDVVLELMHAQKAAEYLVSVGGNESSTQIRPKGVPVSISELFAKLSDMSESYLKKQIIPALNSAFDRQLFNTLRSYHFPNKSRISLSLHKDNRGELFETMKSTGEGQTFVSTTFPGITRGNHYHTRKFERFVVCSGRASISLRRLFSNEIISFEVDGDEPCAIDMPTFVAHNITNTGDVPLVTLFWANEVFTPHDPDTYAEPVSL